MSKNKKWLEANGKQVSEFGGRVADLLAELFGGLHHIDNEAKNAEWSQDKMIQITVRDGQFSTYDNDLLTRLVILAHKHNIRAGIKGASYRYLYLVFVPVEHNGFFRDNHPTIDELIEYCHKLENETPSSRKSKTT